MRPHRARPLRLPFILGAVLVLVLSGCGRGEAPPAPHEAATTPASPSFPLSIADDDGVTVRIAAAPKRIVTFAPSVTEILFALGLGDRLVGVSGPYDDYPPAATEIEEVGGAGDFGVDPNIEKVVSLEPDLFLTIEGGDQWKERLRELGVPVFTLDSTSFGDTLHDIRTVARLVGAIDAGDELVGKMRAEAADVEARIAGRTPVSCFFEVFYPPLTTVGPDTFIADLLKRAGCDSVSAGAKSDYPQWSVDDLVSQAPDAYLVSSESGVSPGAVAKRPGFDAIAAVADGRVVLIDSDLVSRPGPRIVDGLRQLARALHPDAFG